MKIQKLDEKTVRVLLSAADLQQFQITYEQMNYSDEKTKQAILMIVRQIKSQTGLPVESVRLFIEAFPDEKNGCILYVNLIESSDEKKMFRCERTSFDTPIGLEFDNIDILTDACTSLLHEFGHLITKSALYLYEGKYRLLLYTYCKMEKKIISLLEEYGTYLGKGSVLCAFIQEHSNAIASEHAVETIVTYLS